MTRSTSIVDQLSDLDAYLSSDDIFHEAPGESRARLVGFLRDATAHHIATNEYYARYCRRLGFSPDRLEDDPSAVPLLPSAVFKGQLAHVQSNDAPSTLVTTSSGTQGTLSRVPRDNDTLMRFFASVSAGVQEILEIEHKDVKIYCLGPTAEESEHLWISYVMAGVSVYYPSKFYVSGGAFAIDELLEDLRSVDSDQFICVVGPPALMLDTTRELERTGGLDFGDNAVIITMGGWKTRLGERVARSDFDWRIAKAFGLTGEHSVRDVYNMVELNTVIFECREHRKHCPPWLLAWARHPRTLRVLPSGETGVLCFADPTPTSYPGFVLSDDFGTVHREVACACGVTGDIIEIDRRVNKLESRGCALKI